MKQLEMLYEGKAKQVFRTDDPDKIIIHYKDAATAFNNIKKATIEGKGVLNNAISTIIFKELQKAGVKTHYVETINDHHAVALGAATYEELNEMYAMTAKINEVLKGLFLKMNIKLVDFKIEFGKTLDGEIVLADEVSPDTCRLWDATTNEKLDKDRFRRDLGKVREAYEEILARLKKITA